MSPTNRIEYPMAITLFYLMAIVMFALSLTICEKFVKSFNIENEGQGVEERNLRHSTGNVRIHTGDFFQNFRFLETYLYAKYNTHTHSDRQG